MNQRLIDAMADLNEDVLYDEVKASLKSGVSVADIINDLQAGMVEVGTRFAAKEYFLSELIMSAEILKEAQKLLGDMDVSDDSDTIGTFVIGTVKDDIHDIGKNIVVSVMRANGFKVIDLGVDVRTEAFVKAVQEYQPELVGMSCLLTTCFDSMRDTVSAVRALDTKAKILIGGGPVDDSVCKYVGADYVCSDAYAAVLVSKERCVSHD